MLQRGGPRAWIRWKPCGTSRLAILGSLGKSRSLGTEPRASASGRDAVGYYRSLTATVVLAASVLVRWIANGVTSNGILSRADSSEIGLAFISVIWFVQGSTLMRDPSGRAAICCRLVSCNAGDWLEKRARRASVSALANWLPTVA